MSYNVVHKLLNSVYNTNMTENKYELLSFCLSRLYMYSFFLRTINEDKKILEQN